MSSQNYFATLNAIDVSKHVEKKGNFSYLSWPYAAAQLRLADPAATWVVGRFGGLPYLATDAGVFVNALCLVLWQISSMVLSDGFKGSAMP